MELVRVDNLDLTPDERQLVQQVMQGLDHNDRAYFDELSDHEKLATIKILRELKDQGNSDSLKQLWDVDYEKQPVPPEIWFNSPYYLGERVCKDLRPLWRKEIVDVLNSNVIEWIISGSIGGGKTYASMLALLYKIHELVCLRDPCGYYNAQSIVFAFFSVALDLATGVEFNFLKNFITQSPYWCDIVHLETDEERPHKISQAIFNFPKGVSFVFGSRANHILSRDVYAGLMDEVAFSGSSEEKQIVALYTAIRRRLVSRYRGKKVSEQIRQIPGLLCVVSSAQHEGDWLDMHVKESHTRSSVHITSAALYEAKEDWNDNPRFRVVVGDQLHRSYIVDEVNPKSGEVLRNPETLPPDARVIEVPNAFYEDFTTDVEGALRDISGIAIFSSSPLIPQRDRIRECIDPNRRHPFSIDEPILDLYKDDSLEEIFLIEELFDIVDPFRQIYRMKVNPGSPRFIGVDLAKNQCSIGLSCCHMSGLKEVTRRDKEGRPFTEYAPIIYFDFILRIRPPLGSESDLGKIRSFIFFLIEKGLSIGMVSYDQYQSLDSMQQLEKAGIPTKRVSVDAAPSLPYMTTKSVIIENRASYYAYPPFINEITAAQLDREKMRVSYPPGGSKDVIDSVAQCVFCCVSSDVALEHINDAVLVDNNGRALEINRPRPDDMEDRRNVVWTYSDHEDAESIVDVIDNNDLF